MYKVGILVPRFEPLLKRGHGNIPALYILQDSSLLSRRYLGVVEGASSRDRSDGLRGSIQL